VVTALPKWPRIRRSALRRRRARPGSGGVRREVARAAGLSETSYTYTLNPELYTLNSKR